MKLSIVTSLYHSEPYVDEFHRRACAAAEAIAPDFEMVLVNDGSPDRALDKALALQSRDARVVVVDLSRNFGHHKAMMTGLAHAEGERVFLIDADLEEQPEWLAEFAARMDRAGGDVVYGVQSERRGGWFDRWSGRLFYRLLRLLTRLDIEDDYTTARLMSRRYVKALLMHDEREIDIGGLWLITGFEQHAHPVTKLARSESTYTLRRKLSLAVNSITSFSNAPLVGIFYLGVFILAVSAAASAFVLVRWLNDDLLSGWTSLILSVWLLGGLIISVIGVIGIYLAKVFSESKRRPYTIVREIYGRGSEKP